MSGEMSRGPEGFHLQPNVLKPVDGETEEERQRREAANREAETQAYSDEQFADLHDRSIGRKASLETKTTTTQKYRDAQADGSLAYRNPSERRTAYKEAGLDDEQISEARKRVLGIDDGELAA